MNGTASGNSTFIGRVVRALKTLANGMRVTMYYLLHPKTVVTQQYPENRAELKLFERTRAQLRMIHDENDFHRCTACKFCEQACPNGSLNVLLRPKPALARTELDALLWRLDSCTFCNACVQVCPYGVLKFEPNFEGAVFDRRLLIYNMSHYAGAPANVLLKVADAADRLKAIEPRTPYYGPLPMCGKQLPGVAAVGLEPQAPAEASPQEHKEPDGKPSSN